MSNGLPHEQFMPDKTEVEVIPQPSREPTPTPDENKPLTYIEGSPATPGTASESKKESIRKQIDNFNHDEYYEKIYRMENKPVVAGKPEQPVQVEKKVFKDKYQGNIIQCQIKTAEFFDIPISHLKEGAIKLNGKKIDGFNVSELIGRFGYFNGEKLNRADLAAKHKRTVAELDIAYGKLKDILKEQDIVEAFNRHVTNLRIEKDINNLKKEFSS